MARLLGIDTGGTFTDAVILDEDAPHPGILAKAKALTTRDDLSRGIAEAVDCVLDGSKVRARDISLTSVSTTLATNALVEGRGARVCLVLIGFEDGVLARGGLGEALGSDPVIFIDGGHSTSGERQAPLDTEGLRAGLSRHAAHVAAVAVVAYFAARDPIDEIRARDIIAEECGLPVTCGHDLATHLNGPKRAVTAVLNARLIGMIARLIEATEATLAAREIASPLMVVRGDGSLVSADFARMRPIETILSGPAASLVGAAHLTGKRDAVVSDIGGTTTDIAVLADGRPAIRADGARVGGHHTMVEAVDMSTHGLGGDSDVQVDDTALHARLLLGPQRVVPVSLMAWAHPAHIHPVLDRQLDAQVPHREDGRFVLKITSRASATSLDPGSREARLLERLPDAPLPFAQAAQGRADARALRRLTQLGLVQVAGFTPSDAAHVLKRHNAWDATAAEKAARLLSRQRDASGQRAAATADALAEMVLDTLAHRSAEALLETALRRDDLAEVQPRRSSLIQAALRGHSGVTSLNVGLALPVVGLGAPAPHYYPDIARRLGAEPVIPEHADVANAVGAIAGRVRIARTITVSQPVDGRFRVHMPTEPEDFPTLAAASERAQAAVQALAREDATRAGADGLEVSCEWHETAVDADGQRMFLEGTATAIASGRPRLGAT